MGIIGMSPILYRYIDSITVPLQMIEFNLILKAVKPDISAGMFWRLLLGTICMLAFGYLGEGGYINPWFGFAVGMAGWGYILQEIFVGEAGKCDPQNKYVKESFNTMRLIVTAGWSIYPFGYFFGYLLAALNQEIALNTIYNLADFVNKIGSAWPFGHVPRTAQWTQLAARKVPSLAERNEAKQCAVNSVSVV